MKVKKARKVKAKTEIKVPDDPVAAALKTLGPYRDLVPGTSSLAKNEIANAFKYLDDIVAEHKKLLLPQTKNDLNALIDSLNQSRKLLTKQPEWEFNNKSLADSIAAYIDNCKMHQYFYTQHRPRRIAPREKVAAVLARNLIDKYRPKNEKVSTSRGGRWHTLSAILAGGGPQPGGHPRPCCFNHMRAFDPSWLPFSEGMFAWLETIDM